MSNRNLLLTLMLIVAAGMVFCLPGTAQAAEIRQIRINGESDPLTGYLRRISQARYLIQTEDAYLEILGDMIQSVDGKPGVPSDPSDDELLVFATFYEQIQPDGDVVIWTRNHVTNQSNKVMTSTRWGVAQHELQLHQEMEVYDSYGNRLELTLTPWTEGRHRAEVKFLVPVAPGEIIDLSQRIVRHGAAKLEDGAWSYSFAGDFAEDRFLTRKVELPAGAQMVETDTDWQKLDHEGRTLLILRRYFPARVVDRQVAAYRLPEK